MIKKTLGICFAALTALFLSACAGTMSEKAPGETLPEYVRPYDSEELNSPHETSGGTSEDPYEGQYTFRIQPQLILDVAIYNADSDPTIGWTVVAADPGKVLSCTIDGWLYRMGDGGWVLLGGLSQEIGITATPQAPEEYAFYHHSCCFHRLFTQNGKLPSPPYVLEPGEYMMEYAVDGQRATATFTVIEPLECPHS